MTRFVFIIILCIFSFGISLNDIQRNQFIQLHNAIRANVTPVAVSPLPPFSYNIQLEDTAQPWANQCNFLHNANRSAGFSYYVGENVCATFCLSVWKVVFMFLIII